MLAVDSPLFFQPGPWLMPLRPRASTASRASPVIAGRWSRPARAAPPSHNLAAGLIGGGQVAIPGEVSLAHHGIPFLAELPEFKRHVLEVLRQPLEEGMVAIARVLVLMTVPVC